jgi:hypothetical protein
MGCGVSPPPRSIGIANLAENFEVIHGAQEFRGKILSRKDLGPIEQFLFTRFRLGYDVLSASRSARTESRRDVIENTGCRVVLVRDRVTSDLAVGGPVPAPSASSGPGPSPSARRRDIHCVVWYQRSRKPGPPAVGSVVLVSSSHVRVHSTGVSRRFSLPNEA